MHPTFVLLLLCRTISSRWSPLPPPQLQQQTLSTHMLHRSCPRHSPCRQVYKRIITIKSRHQDNDIHSDDDDHTNKDKNNRKHTMQLVENRNPRTRIRANLTTPTTQRPNIATTTTTRETNKTTITRPNPIQTAEGRPNNDKDVDDKEKEGKENRNIKGLDHARMPILKRTKERHETGGPTRVHL